MAYVDKLFSKTQQFYLCICGTRTLSEVTPGRRWCALGKAVLHLLFSNGTSSDMSRQSISSFCDGYVLSVPGHTRGQGWRTIVTLTVPVVQHRSRGAVFSWRIFLLLISLKARFPYVLHNFVQYLGHHMGSSPIIRGSFLIAAYRY